MNTQFDLAQRALGFNDRCDRTLGLRGQRLFHDLLRLSRNRFRPLAGHLGVLRVTALAP